MDVSREEREVEKSLERNYSEGIIRTKKSEQEAEEGKVSVKNTYTYNLC